MAERFRRVNLTRCFNSAARLRPRAGRWAAGIGRVAGLLPRGRQQFWGIPFSLGPKDLDKRGVIVLAGSKRRARVPLVGRATHICVLHFCDVIDPDMKNAAGGERLAEYRLVYADRGRRSGDLHHCVPIRRRFEIGPFRGGWGEGAFGAVGTGMPQVMPQDPTRYGWGGVQTGVHFGGIGFGCWVFALENPHPERELAAIEFEGAGAGSVAILGVTLYQGPGHPLRHVPRRVYRLLLPPGESTKLSDLQAEMDMGVVTRIFAVPGRVDESWLRSPEAGLGAVRPDDRPSREFLVEASGAEGAVLKVGTGVHRHELPIGEAFSKGAARSPDGRARIELIHPGKTWVHVTVVDGETGKPTPTRIHFRGPHGEYLPPYGHHQVVNEGWFEDYGGDLQLGGTSYAYVPGRFQVDLPVGEVYVEIAKGFEYQPVRRRLQIKPGQRELRLRIDRWANWRKEGWVTADTHVHFVSPQTAWLEGQGEGLNLINLLASQWGRLFTNVGDITGELSGCSADDTLVWVGTENRHHLLGHISLLGTRGDPVFPMCDGAPGEAYIGDPDMLTLTDWAEMCRQREGVVIRPHFPSPICEEPVYFALEKLDGAELRQFGPPEALDQFCFREWYRYLNCGYRVAAVGGTDKMSAGMPVGGARTYAKLGADEEFTFANWGKAVRAGRTFTTSGPLMDLKLEGREMGEEVRLPSGGGTVEVEASAASAWPLHRLELVVNGQVAACESSAAGSKALKLRRTLTLKGSSWIAARCGSNLRVNHCWPIHLGAHTSPVYVIVANQEIFSPSDATYMLTLIDGGITYLDTLSIRYDEERHRAMKAMFEKARERLHGRLHAHGHTHTHG
jgi:hypothetical protein